MSMNPNLVITIVVVVLALLCVILSLLVTRLWYLHQLRCRQTEDPSMLSPILGQMLARVRVEADWGTLERMREELRHALLNIDELRHDPSQNKLRNSKVNMRR